MGIASVHYLSMNVTNGKISVSGDVLVGGTKNYVLSSLNPEDDYTIDWGDGGATTAAETDAQGSVTKQHTYSAAGEYDIVVTSDATSQVVAKLTVLVLAPEILLPEGDLIEGEEYEFSVRYLLPSSDYKIDWGDGTTAFEGTSTSGGILTEDHIYSTAGTYDIVVEDDASVEVATAEVVVVEPEPEP